MSGRDYRLFYIEDQFWVLHFKRTPVTLKQAHYSLGPIHDTVQTARQPTRVCERFLRATKLRNTASVLYLESERKVPQNHSQSTPNT